MRWSDSIYFKHVYGPSVGSWGIVGFPSTQPVGTALRRYSRGQPVLLAVTRDPETEDREISNPELYHGKIFAICSFFIIDIRETERLANPEMAQKYPEVVRRWATAAPIDELFSVRPLKAYDDFADRQLTELARNRRGQLISFAEYPSLVGEVRDWLNTCDAAPQPIIDSDYVAKYRRLFNS